MDSKLKARAITILRRAWLRDSARTKVKERARIARGRYICEFCKKEIGAKDFQIDHIDPIVPLTGWENFDSFIMRTFVDDTKLQLICKEPCHSEKSKRENEERRKNKKEN